MNYLLLNLFLISIIISYFIIYFSLSKLTNLIVDRPNFRSAHNKPKPSSGGISFVFWGIIMTFTLGNYLPVICMPLSIVGLIDDLFSLNNKIRYFVQVITSILILNNSRFGSVYLHNQDVVTIFLFYVILILLITAIINFINFMDGIDGLVCSCSIVILTVAAITIEPSLFIIVGSLVGFLVWNWFPSKIFMGDIGSTFLGAIIAGSLLDGNHLIKSLNLLFVASPLLVDSSFCVVRRLFASEPIFKAHSLHLYQRLYQAGWNHSKITIQYLIATLLIAISLIFNSIIFTIFSFFLVLFYGLFLEKKCAIPFDQSLKIANINK